MATCTDCNGTGDGEWDDREGTLSCATCLGSGHDPDGAQLPHVCWKCNEARPLREWVLHPWPADAPRRNTRYVHGGYWIHRVCGWWDPIPVAA